MHITDKEKKAIYEAMKQIRENRRLQEQELGLYNWKKGNNPVSARMGPLGDHTSNFNEFPRNLQNVDTASMPPFEDIAPNLKRGSDIAQLPSQEELPYYLFNKRMAGALLGINPDGSYKKQTSYGTGRSIGDKHVGIRDARRMRLREQQSRPPSAPMSTPDQYNADRSASDRTSQLGMRLANRRAQRSGLTARGQRTPAGTYSSSGPVPDGSRFNSQTGRWDIQGPKKVPFALGGRSKGRALQEFNLKRLASNLGNAGDVRDIPGQGYNVVPNEYASRSRHGPGTRTSERVSPDANFGTRDFYYGGNQAYFKDRKGNELSAYRDGDNAGYFETEYGAEYGSGRGTAGYKQPSVGTRLDSAAIKVGKGIRGATSSIGQAGRELFGKSNRFGMKR